MAVSTAPKRSARLAPLLILLAASGLLAAARAALGAGDGLAARYYTDANWTEPAALTVADRDISTDQLNRRWNLAPPGRFSARWIGYLTVDAAARYDFAVTSDDGARLWVDNALVVDNSGTHGAMTRSGSAQLGRGPHLIVIDYVQAGGSFALGWLWSRDGIRYSAVPGWQLSRRRASYAEIVVARTLDWLSWAALALAAAAALGAARRGAFDRAWRTITARPRIASLVLFAALAVLELWPLALDPAHLSRNDNGDTMHLEWTLAWVAHQAPRDPRHLFQANIFYPEQNTLAYSDPLLLQSVIAAPVMWAGGSPVLAYNITLLAGFALTGWAMCLVAARWTGDWVAAVTAGVLVGFSAHLLTRMPQIQAQYVQFLPLSMLALDSLLRRPRFRAAAGLALCVALEALASWYMAVFMTFGLAAAFLARPDAWWGGRARAVFKYLAVSVALALVLLLPYAVPYWMAGSQHAFGRSIDDLLPTFWQDYLTTPGRVDHWLLGRWTSFTGLFPGFIGLGLAAYAVRRGVLRDPRARMCAALGACGVWLSFGADAPGYAFLFHILPPLRGIRLPARFGFLGTVAVAVLAAYGVADLRRRISRPMAAATAILIPTLVTLETLAAPLSLNRFEGIPAIYHRLDAVPDAVVAELPMPPHQVFFRNAPYQLYSTTSWYRLLNGYSSYLPASYFAHYDALQDFPSAAAIGSLQRYGVTHVFVHLDALAPARRAELAGAAGLRGVAQQDQVILYEVLGRQ